jgi:hypothetical protein
MDTTGYLASTSYKRWSLAPRVKKKKIVTMTNNDIIKYVIKKKKNAKKHCIYDRLDHKKDI